MKKVAFVNLNARIGGTLQGTFLDEKLILTNMSGTESFVRQGVRTEYANSREGPLLGQTAKDVYARS